MKQYLHALILMAALVFWMNPEKTHAQAILNFTHNQPALLAANAGPDLHICPGDSVSIGIGHTGGTAPITWLWSPSDSLNSINGPTAMANPTLTTTYTVVATDTRNCTGQDMMTVFVDTCVGINPLLSGGYWTIYPNPNNGIFKMEIQLDAPVAEMEFVMTTTEGRIIYSKNYSNASGKIMEEISLVNQSKGFYLLQLKTAEGSLVKRILFQ